MAKKEWCREKDSESTFLYEFGGVALRYMPDVGRHPYLQKILKNEGIATPKLIKCPDCGKKHRAKYSLKGDYYDGFYYVCLPAHKKRVKKKKRESKRQ